MTKGEGKVYRLTAVEALAVQLRLRATATAGAAAKERGYPVPTPEQLHKIQEGLAYRCAGAAALVLAAAFAPGEPVVATDDQLDRIADGFALEVLAEVLGPPPGAN